jgi:hypothetical protein
MPQGISIHIGLNVVDPNHYDGWDGRLLACEADASDMRAIAEEQGFSATTILTAQATAQAVTEALTNAAGVLASGDTLLVTYSGHGGQVPDQHGDEGADARDETWVLFDRQLVDDELYALWGGFKRGVRIFVISDSCHSGTMTRAARDVYGELAASPVTRGFDPGAAPRFRNLPPNVVEATYREHRDLYDGIQRAFPKGDLAKPEASIVLFSGCQDNQLSQDGDRNGLFTQRLREIWKEGGYRGGYRRFHREIVALMPPWQTPNYFWIGRRNAAFERKRPFTR